jgi:hypothetical protein
MHRYVAPLLSAAVLTAVVFLPAHSSAQTLTAGIKGGVNIANVDITTSDLTISPKRRTGAVGGVFAGVDVNGKGGVIVEVLFSQRGTRAEFEDEGFQITDTFDIDYIEIPVLGRGTFKASDDVMVHLFAGPSFAFRVRDDERVEINGVDVTDESEPTELKAADVGLAVGITLDIRRFLIEGRYTYGFTNINDTPDEADLKVKNRTVSVTVGFRFR